MTRVRQLESQLLQAVIDQLPLGIVVAESPSGRLTHANRRAAELLGRHVEAESVDEYAAFGLLTTDGRRLDAHDVPLARAILHGAVVNDERVRTDVEGGPRTLSTSAAPIRDGAGTTIAAVFLFDDATARERRERAERDFVANAAHQLQTPLAAIVSAVDVLQAGAKDDPAERERFLSHVSREAERLARLARSLLVLARAQTRDDQPKLEIVPLRPLLRELARGLSPVPGVRVSVRCGHGVAALTDRDLIEHVVSNLAANAVRYTRSGRIALSARATREHAVVEIVDTGPGIPTEERERVFDRFYRAGTHDSEGFGLGLAIVAQALEVLGGSIEVAGEPGRGTTMRVRLPVARLLDR